MAAVGGRENPVEGPNLGLSLGYPEGSGCEEGNPGRGGGGSTDPCLSPGGRLRPGLVLGKATMRAEGGALWGLGPNCGLWTPPT